MRAMRMRWLVVAVLAGAVWACSHARNAEQGEISDDSVEAAPKLRERKKVAGDAGERTGSPASTPATDGSTTSTEKSGDKALVRKTTVIDFSDVELEGDLPKPQGEYSMSRSKAQFPASPPPPPSHHVGVSAGGDVPPPPMPTRPEPVTAAPPREPVVDAAPECEPMPLMEATEDEEKPSLWNRLFGSKQEEAKPEPAKPPPPPPPKMRAKEANTQKPAVVDVPEESHPPTFEQHAPNPFVTAAEDRLSTFAVDVDTASYTFARRSLIEGQLPNPDGVRVEEFLNYFKYEYPAPNDGKSFSINMDAAPSPFDSKHTLVRVGLQGRKVSISERKPAHLTFLVDVSGSMQTPDRLPLAKRSLRILVDNLHDGDTVGLVTYAGSVREVLPPTDLAKKAEIHAAIENLSAGGSTAMGDGLQLAYRQALRMVKPGHVSRVIVLTDGDANVGLTSHQEILKTIAGYVQEGVTLSTIGFGMGNYRDDMLEQLADKGNGNYFYVDGISQARRVFQEQLGGTLEVIAKDVKIQVEFDPKVVSKYRLVGYENRAIADRDFRDDKVDAGEIGAGHSVTAMYELELTGAQGALATVRVRAKPPEGQTASEWEQVLPTTAIAKSFEASSADFRFATAVMASAEILRQSSVAASWKWPEVEKIARQSMQRPIPERIEFIELMERARTTIGPLAMK